MKKLFLLILISIISFQVQSQTDLEIADAIIGKPYSKLDGILTEMGIEFYITSDKESKVTLYLSKNNSVRLWEIKHEDLERSVKVNNAYQYVNVGVDLILEIYVRYRHSNLNDLKEFHSYELHEEIKFREYEKSMGDKLSHLRVTQK